MAWEEPKPLSYAYAAVVMAIAGVGAIASSVAYLVFHRMSSSEVFLLLIVVAPFAAFAALAHRHAYRYDHLTVMLLVLIPSVLHSFLGYWWIYSNSGPTLRTLAPMQMTFFYIPVLGFLAILLEIHFWATQPERKAPKRRRHD